MKIRISTLRRAFFQVYGELATAEAQFVDLDEIREAWGHTGFRHGDLSLVIQDLKRRHMVILMERGRRTVLRLEKTGVEECHEPVGGVVGKLKDWLLLIRVGLRRISGQAAVPRQRRRRAGDRPRVPGRRPSP